MPACLYTQTICLSVCECSRYSAGAYPKKSHLFDITLRESGRQVSNDINIHQAGRLGRSRGTQVNQRTMYHRLAVSLSLALMLLIDAIYVLYAQ